ncbi:MAG: Spy/CpxP family protein refolding chaperone [Ideonella sp.]|nr:Spy/CpxP family protein refolding chaperone [Ideonella sp.]
MKTATKIIAATVTLASLAAASVVLAHPGQGMGMGPGMGMGMMGHGMGPGMGQGMGMGPGMGMMGHGMGPGMAGRMHGPQTGATAASHLSELKAQLKITAAQEPAWQKFDAFVRQQAETSQAMRTTMQAQMQAQRNDPKAAPIDYAAQREAMGKLRDTHLAARDAARKELYAVLTPEQKAIADQHMRPGRGHRMAMRTPAK